MTARPLHQQMATLRNLASSRAVFGPDFTRAQTIGRLELLLEAGMTRDDAIGLIADADTAPAHQPEQEPAAGYWALVKLLNLADTRAVYGIAVDREETFSRICSAIYHGLTQAEAGRLIRTANAAPPHPTEKSPLPLATVTGLGDLTFTDGHYAVIHGDVLRFYQIYVPAQGQYNNQQVIRRMASSNLMALYPSEAEQVLRAIHDDPVTAAYRYSDELGQCWACASPLTDPVSRLLSVGPTCRGFSTHSGLQAAARDLDHDPSRRLVFRALRRWALEMGFHDPHNKQDRASMKGMITASLLASAWSGLPGLLRHEPDQVLDFVRRAIAGDLDPVLHDAMMAAPRDTMLVLLASNVLSGPVLQALGAHPDRQVNQAAGEAFLDILSGRR